MRVDDAGQLGRDCRPPPVPRTAVDVFGVALAGTCALGNDDDRGPADRVEGTLDESE